MKEKTKHIFTNNLLKLSLGGIIPSIICTAICTFKPTYSVVMISEYASNFVILLWSLYVLYDSRMKLKGKVRYYCYNLSALAVYFVFGVGSSAFVSLMNFGADSVVSMVHTFLFFNFKILHYVSFNENYGYGIGIFSSAVYYALVYIAIVLLFPLVINKEKILEKEEAEEDSLL